MTRQTGALFLILNSKLRPNLSASTPTLYSNMDAQWYAEVGEGLVKVMVINFVTSPAINCATYAVTLLRRRLARHHAPSPRPALPPHSTHGVPRPVVTPLR